VTASEDIDFERLSTHLKALAHPARLELLWRLRIPAPAAEVVIKPRRKDADLQPERAMSRQAIMEHIEVLESVGVVNRLPSEEKEAGRFVTSAQHVFVLIEEMRRLAAIEPSLRVDVDATMAQESGTATAWAPGPKLVLVSGPWEGRAFPLSGKGPWTLGRSRDRTVPITYDPFASAEHARIEKNGATFALASEAGARNPARVNFEPLTAGKPRALAPGDIIGVGRSLLAFQPA
jgi:hypothetical protein